MNFVPLILIALYLIFTFGYSAIEKLTGWKESVRYYQSHLKDQRFIRTHIGFFLKMVVAAEFITGLFLLAGIFELWFFKHNSILIYGFILGALTLTGLMLGQRMAKDYPGAMSITVYFILCVIGLYLST